MKRKILIPFLLVIMSIAMVFGVVACGGGSNSGGNSGGGSTSGSGITLDSTEISVEAGSNATVIATVSNNGTIDTWTIADTSIATVTGLGNTGIVVGVSEGTTTLTATSGDYTATCTVTVTAAVTYTVYSGSEAVTSVSVVKGDTATLTISASDGSTVSYWASSNTDVVTVSGGTITGVSYGTATIYAGKDSSHCTEITVTVTGAEGSVAYSLGESTTEADALDSTHDIWYYWSEWAILTTSEYEDGTITLTFTNNAGNWYNLQLFYKNDSLAEGSTYKLSCTVYTTSAGSITLNGTVFTLEAGSNDISVNYTESSSSSASFQFGVDGVGTSIVDGTIKISNVNWTKLEEETLIAPTLTVTDGVIYITDNNDADKVSGYKLYLYDGDGNVSGAVTVTNGMKVSDIDTNTIAKGSYKGYLRAIGSSSVYYDSANSTNYVEIEVTTDPVYDLTYAGETAAVAAAGSWYYWKESGTLSECSYNSGTITVTFSGNAGNWYNIQLFYKNPQLTTGQAYKLTFNLNTTVAGSIYVNGTVCTLVEGDNSIEVTYTEGTGASGSIQFGIPETIDITSATFIITNMVWTETDEIPSSGDSGITYDAADFTNLVSQLNATGTYDITHEGEDTATANSGTVYVWYVGDYDLNNNWAPVSNTDVTANYNNGTITWSTKNEYTALYWYANQLFYENSSLTEGTTYMLTLTINSATAGSITVNGTVVNLTAGENSVTVFYTEGTGASISIQLGVNNTATNLTAPSLTISDIAWYSK